jgi:hypothetical protein
MMASMITTMIIQAGSRSVLISPNLSVDYSNLLFNSQRLWITTG